MKNDTRFKVTNKSLKILAIQSLVSQLLSQDLIV